MPSVQGPETARALAPAIAAALLGALVLFAPQIFNDGDTWWHVATGDWVLDHRSVPHVDIFSFTRPGAPWVAHEWLSEVAMALAWRAGGWTGVAVLFACAMAVTGWLLVRRLSLALGGVTLLLTSVLALACMAPSLLARPHLLVLPLLLAWTIEMLEARREGRAPRLVFALLMLAWANLHGSYVFGFLLVGAFGLEALIEETDRLAVIRRWGPFGAACLVASLLTPHGVHGLIYPFQIMTMSALPGITEWRGADFSKPSIFEVALVTTLFVGLGRGVRIPTVRLLLLLLLLHMSLQHVRHQLVLALVAPLILAEPMAAALGHAPGRARLGRRLLGGCAAVAVCLVGLRLALPIVRGDGINSPITAVARLPDDLASQPVFNEYGFGGYLIYKGIRPFIDGRSDMYGDAFTRNYFAADSADAAALDAFLVRHGVTWTILAADNPIVAVLDHDPHWVRIHTDATAVVHRRRAAPPAIKTPQTVS